MPKHGNLAHFATSTTLFDTDFRSGMQHRNNHTQLEKKPKERTTIEERKVFETCELTEKQVVLNHKA